MALNARSKGKRGEYLVRDMFKEHGYEARRGQQFSGSPESPDVIVPSLPQLHLEVKFVENLNIRKAMDQSIRDSAPGQIPVVFHKRSNTPWLITMDALKWFEFLKAFLEHEKITTQSNQNQTPKSSGELPPCTSGVGG